MCIYNIKIANLVVSIKSGVIHVCLLYLISETNDQLF